MNNLLKLSFLVIPTVYFSQNFAVSSIPEELKNKANIVVRNEVSTYVINSIDNMEIDHQNVFTVMNKAGEDDATVVIPYDKSTKVSDIKVQILDADGKVIGTGTAIDGKTEISLTRPLQDNEEIKIIITESNKTPLLPKDMYFRALDFRSNILTCFRESSENLTSTVLGIRFKNSSLFWCSFS